jgi:hypothetical protein
VQAQQPCRQHNISDDRYFKGSRVPQAMKRWQHEWLCRVQGTTLQALAAHYLKHRKPGPLQVVSNNGLVYACKPCKQVMMLGPYYGDTKDYRSSLGLT